MRTNFDDKERLPAAVDAGSAPETTDCWADGGGGTGGFGISGIIGWVLLTAPPAPAASKRLLLTGIDSGRDDEEFRRVSATITELSLPTSVVVFSFKRQNKVD